MTENIVDLFHWLTAEATALGAEIEVLEERQAAFVSEGPPLPVAHQFGLRLGERRSRLKTLRAGLAALEMFVRRKQRQLDLPEGELMRLGRQLGEDRPRMRDEDITRVVAALSGFGQPQQPRYLDVDGIWTISGTGRQARVVLLEPSAVAPAAAPPPRGTNVNDLHNHPAFRGSSSRLEDELARTNMAAERQWERRR